MPCFQSFLWENRLIRKNVLTAELGRSLSEMQIIESNIENYSDDVVDTARAKTKIDLLIDAGLASEELNESDVLEYCQVKQQEKFNSDQLDPVLKWFNCQPEVKQAQFLITLKKRIAANQFEINHFSLCLLGELFQLNSALILKVKLFQAFYFYSLEENAESFVPLIQRTAFDLMEMESSPYIKLIQILDDLEQKMSDEPDFDYYLNLVLDMVTEFMINAQNPQEDLLSDNFFQHVQAFAHAKIKGFSNSSLVWDHGPQDCVKKYFEFPEKIKAENYYIYRKYQNLTELFACCNPTKEGAVAGVSGGESDQTIYSYKNLVVSYYWRCRLKNFSGSIFYNPMLPIAPGFVAKYASTGAIDPTQIFEKTAADDYDPAGELFVFKFDSLRMFAEEDRGPFREEEFFPDQQVLDFVKTYSQSPEGRLDPYAIFYSACELSRFDNGTAGFQIIRSLMSFAKSLPEDQPFVFDLNKIEIQYLHPHVLAWILEFNLAMFTKFLGPDAESDQSAACSEDYFWKNVDPTGRMTKKDKYRFLELNKLFVRKDQEDHFNLRIQRVPFWIQRLYEEYLNSKTWEEVCGEQNFVQQESVKSFLRNGNLYNRMAALAVAGKDPKYEPILFKIADFENAESVFAKYAEIVRIYENLKNRLPKAAELQVAKSFKAIFQRATNLLTKVANCKTADEVEKYLSQLDIFKTEIIEQGALFAGIAYDKNGQLRSPEEIDSWQNELTVNLFQCGDLVKNPSRAALSDPNNYLNSKVFNVRDYQMLVRNLTEAYQEIDPGWLEHLIDNIPNDLSNSKVEFITVRDRAGRLIALCKRKKVDNKEYYHGSFYVEREYQKGFDVGRYVSEYLISLGSEDCYFGATVAAANPAAVRHVEHCDAVGDSIVTEGQLPHQSDLLINLSLRTRHNFETRDRQKFSAAEIQKMCGDQTEFIYNDRIKIMRRDTTNTQYCEELESVLSPEGWHITRMFYNLQTNDPHETFIVLETVK